MDALEMLCSRVSVPKLIEPGPNQQQLEQIKSAALRAADHARLQPWRFLVISGDGLERLGAIFVEIAARDNPAASSEELGRAKSKPLRAPTIIVAIASIKEHPKVPEIEQILSAGCAVQNMLNAAHAISIGAIWRTGPVAYDALLAQRLGLSSNEKVIGFIYLGTPAGALKSVPSNNTDDFFEQW